MKCPFCNSAENGVVDSRDTDDGRAVRRRRVCEACNRRFTTYERLEETPLLVVKKDNRRQLFDRNKIIAGLTRACEKRPVSIQKLEEIAAQIERKAYELGEKEIAAQWFGEQAMSALKELDEVAYVRFASVYRSFRDAEEFVQELDKLRREFAQGGAVG